MGNYRIYGLIHGLLNYWRNDTTWHKLNVKDSQTVSALDMEVKTIYITKNNILTREDCSLTPILPNSNQGVQGESKGVKFKESAIMVYGYIYKIVNTRNNKVYIGQTTQNPKMRMFKHISDLRKNRHKNPHLQSSFNKYGESNFNFMVLNYATDKNTLDKLENDYILHYNCLDNNHGYNMKEGGGNGKHSKETCKRISESRIGEKNPMYGKRGELNPLYGIKFSSERCQKMSEFFREYYKNNPEVRKKISQSLQGRKNPEHGKRMMGELNPFYGKHHSEEAKKKIRDGRKGKRHSERSRIKMAKSRRGNGLFGFTCVTLDKRINPENRPWKSRIKYNNYRKFLGSFEDPLTCEIIHDLVFDAIYEGI